MVINVRYDKLGDKRYLRTITRNNQILNLPLNLGTFRIETKKDLDRVFEKVKKMLMGKGRKK